MGLLLLFGVAAGCNVILGNEEPVLLNEGGGGGPSSSSSSSGSCEGNASTAIQGCGGGLAWPHWVPEKAKTYLPTTETVHDSVTGLMWQRKVSPDSYTWQEAKDDCEALELSGYCDWRLPSRIELGSIVDYTMYNPLINTTAFPNTPPEFFWSSSTFVGAAGHVWIVGFGDVVDSNADVAATHRVRCVR